MNKSGVKRRRVAFDPSKRTIRILVIDDHYDMIEAKLTEYLHSRAQMVGRVEKIDFVATWSDTNFAQTDKQHNHMLGIHYFCKHRYDLVVLDASFDGQNCNGDGIYRDIRSGNLAKNQATSYIVPVIVLTEDKSAEQRILQLFPSRAGDPVGYELLTKVCLRDGTTRKTDEFLDRLWRGTGIVMHIGIPHHASFKSRQEAMEEATSAFSVIGAQEPQKYQKLSSPAYKSIIWALAPPENGVIKVPFTFNIRQKADSDHDEGRADELPAQESNETPLDQYLRIAWDRQSNNCKKQLGKQLFQNVLLMHSFEAGAPGTHIIDGIVEIKLHFENPQAWGISESTLAFSRFFEPHFADVDFFTSPLRCPKETK